MMRTALGVVVILLGACQWLTEPREAVEVRVVEVFEMIQPESDGGPWSVEFQVTNNGRRQAYLYRCGWIGSMVEREQDGVWVQFSGAACQTVYDMSPIAIAPGETLSGTRVVWGPGRYRLRIGVMSDLAGEYEWSVLSNEFYVP
jgi:hypothetical protein